MKKLKIEDINKPNSSTWTACNNDSKYKIYRKEFLAAFGGEFIQNGRYVKWQTIQKTQPVYVPKRLLYFIDPNKRLVGIDNVMEYCVTHKLSKSAMYDVLKGKRKSHKGYTLPYKEPTPEPVTESPIEPVDDSGLAP